MADQHTTAAEPLTAPYLLEYTYKRSLGPILGRFFGGLRDGRIFGVRAADGRVLVPPTEYDPVTSETLTELVEVAPRGVVTTWAWVTAPREKHPLDLPFAWALIRLDGADSAMLHAVDAGSIERMSTGMRVEARWREDRVGGMGDIVAFAPEPLAPAPAPAPARAPARAPAIEEIQIPIRLEYRIAAGRAQTAFLRGLTQRRIVGRRCPSCHKVTVPPRGACPTCGVSPEEEVEVAHEGTVTTFCVVNIPFEGQRLEPPYVCAWIVLDGADIPFFHLVGGVPAAEVRIGMRVKARWADQLAPTLESIRYFEPTGEPDAPFATIREHL